MEFIEIIKKLMSERNLKQADLCRMTGIPSSLMSEYVQGKKSPAITNAIAIANSLDVSLDELVGRNIHETQDCIILLNNAEKNIISPQEQEHLKKYRSLTNEGKERINAMLDFECKQNEPRIKETAM